jgi:hypothetical protein
LVAAALRIEERAVLRDGNLLGRLIDTFVLSQLRPEAEISPLRPRLHHLLEKDGRHEIDLFAELAGGDVAASRSRPLRCPTPLMHATWPGYGMCLVRGSGRAPCSMPAHGRSF